MVTKHGDHYSYSFLFVCLFIYLFLLCDVHNATQQLLGMIPLGLWIWRQRPDLFVSPKTGRGRVVLCDIELLSSIQIKWKTAENSRKSITTQQKTFTQLLYVTSILTFFIKWNGLIYLVRQRHQGGVSCAEVKWFVSLCCLILQLNPSQISWPLEMLLIVNWQWVDCL